MKIRIPHTLARVWDRFGDWANAPIFRRYIPREKPLYWVARSDIRRIDVIVALGFIGCVSWYGYTTGWRGALMGGVMYLAVAAMALWLL